MTKARRATPDRIAASRPVRHRPQRVAASPRARSSPGPILLAIGAVIVLVAGIAALLISRGSESVTAVSTRPPTAEAARPVGAPLPAFVNTADDPAIGLRIPEVAGASFDGSLVPIRNDGRPKLLLFLAHWCAHCQREVPIVQAWLDRGGLPNGVDLVSVATSIDETRPNFPPRAWLEREHWTPPVLVDIDGSAATAYGLAAFPYWVAVNADTRVVSRLTGELTPDQLDRLVASIGP